MSEQELENKPSPILDFLYTVMDGFNERRFKHFPAQLWNNIFDDHNRLVSCSPNYMMVQVEVNHKKYTLMRLDWDVYLYDQPLGHLDFTFETEKSQQYIEHKNVQPDYSKEYWLMNAINNSDENNEQRKLEETSQPS